MLVRPSHIGIDVALLSTHSSSRNSIRQTTVGLHDVYLCFLTQVMGTLRKIPDLTEAQLNKLNLELRKSRKTTTKNAAKMPQINERNRLPLSALRCHRDRLSTAILAPFLAVEEKNL